MNTNKLGLTGRIKNLQESEFTSRDNTPYVKVLLTIECETDVYSWKQREWFNFNKEIHFEHLTTKFKVEKDALYEELWALYNESKNYDNYIVAVGFWIKSEQKEISLSNGGIMNKIDYALKINSIRKVSSGDNEFTPDKEPEAPVDLNGNKDDLPF